MLPLPAVLHANNSHKQQHNTLMKTTARGDAAPNYCSLASSSTQHQPRSEDQAMQALHLLQEASSSAQTAPVLRGTSTPAARAPRAVKCMHCDAAAGPKRMPPLQCCVTTTVWALHRASLPTH
jgi:hypothetical protein